MAIDFSCGCGRRMKVADELAGKRVRCPVCREVTRIPEGDPAEMAMAALASSGDPISTIEEAGPEIAPAIASAPAKNRPAPRRHPPLLLGALLIAAVSGAVGYGLGSHSPLTTGGGAPAASSVEEARRVYQRYLDAQGREAHLALLRNPDRVGPIAEKLTATNPTRVEKVMKPGGVEVPPTGPERSLVVAIPARANFLDLPGTGEDFYAYLVKTPDGFKVDWEATAGYNSMGLDAFKIHRPRETRRFRVFCKLSGYYHGPFREERNTHYSFEIADERGVRIQGYAPKASPQGSRLEAILDGVRPRAVILDLRHVGPDGRYLGGPDDDGDNVTVTRFVSDTWVDWD